MKRFIFYLFLVTFGISGFAKNKIINAPYFLSRNNSAIEISKVTLKPDCTILDVQLYSTKKDSVNVSSKSVLIVDRQEYKLLQKKGLPDNELVSVPNGVIKAQLVFEPIPEDTKSFDFYENVKRGWRINSIYLDGTHPEQSIPQELKDNITEKADLPLPESKFGTMTINGKIIGYSKLAIQNINYVIDDWICFTFKPKSININPDGTFLIKDFVMGPTLKKLQIGGKTLNVFVVPNAKINLTIDMSALTFSQTHLFGKEYANRQIFYFAGEYAGLNNEIALKPYKTDIAMDIPNTGTLSIYELKKIFLSHYNKTVKSLMEDKTISDAYRNLTFLELTSKTFSNISSSKYFIAFSILKPGEKRGNMKTDEHFYDDIIKLDSIYSPWMIMTSSYPSIYSTIKKNYPDMNTQVPQLWKDIKYAEKFSKLADMTIFTDEQLVSIDSIQTQAIRQYIVAKNNDNKRCAEAAANKKDYKVKNLDTLVKGEDILKVILKPHRGRTVLVDFWATWCGPCMRAMKSMIPLKEELKEEAIDYVFVTGESSPEDIWKITIPDIHGEHYRLTNEQWEYLCNSLEFQGIPAYLIVNRKGEITYKVVGFPGEEEMKEELLKATN